MEVPAIFIVVSLIIGFIAGAWSTFVLLAALCITDQQPPTEASDE